MNEFRNLQAVSYDILLDSFSDAFSEYEFPIQMSLEKFKTTLIRRNANLKLSYGLFEKDQLVAFAINGIRLWQGKLTAYDCFTGVRKFYQHQKLGKSLFKQMVPKLQAAGVKVYLLEVLQTNTPAVQLYTKNGFHIERKLLCVAIPKSQIQKLTIEDNYPHTLHLDHLITLPWDRLPSFWECYPSWQNSIDSAQAVADHLRFFGLFLADQLIGYMIIDPQNGDTLHFGIHPDHRRHHFGTYMFTEVAKLISSDAFRILNIDETAHATLNFLQKLQYSLITTQFEMKLEV